jgi:hypothetical protein
MGTIRFNKALPEYIMSTKGELESKLSTLFEAMVHLREEAGRHSGTAVTALQNKMDVDILFFGKAINQLLAFVESVFRFSEAVTAVDDSTNTSILSGKARGELSYSFISDSPEREIKLAPEALSEKTSGFDQRLAVLEEVLSQFHRMLDSMMLETEFPLDDPADIWPEAKQIIASLILEAKTRLKGLSIHAMLVTDELQRVDHLVSQQMRNTK